MNNNLSRRAMVGGLATASTLPAAAFATGGSSVDEELIALGQQLEAVSAALDRAKGHDEAMSLLDKIEALSMAIVAIPAKSLKGLFVKARATAWALQNDCGLLDPAKETSINDRVAASIVRDLLTLKAIT